MNSLYVEQREINLASYATRTRDASWASRPTYSRGSSLVRTPYECDCQIILSSSSLRALSNKCQNLAFRTLADASSRMSHTLQVVDVATRIAAGLHLNIDLTRAIALGHDVGHMPFSHNTQAAIDRALTSSLVGRDFRGDHPVTSELHDDQLAKG